MAVGLEHPPVRKHGQRPLAPTAGAYAPPSGGRRPCPLS